MIRRIVLPVVLLTCAFLVSAAADSDIPPKGFMPFGHLSLSGDSRGFWLFDQETGNIYRYDRVGNRVKRRFMGAVQEPGLPLSPVEAVYNPLAIPRAHVRALASEVLQELRLLSAAVDQWAIETNKRPGTQPTIADIAVYVSNSSRFGYFMNRGICQDTLGNPIQIPAVDELPVVPKASFEFFNGIVTEDFFIPFPIEQ